MSFTTVAKVKSAIRLPAGVTQHDSALGDFVDAANATVLREIGLAGMTEQTYTETLDIEDATPTVVLSRMPVQSIVAVSQSGSNFDASAYYWTEYGKLTLAGSGAFAAGRQALSVTYRAGFTTGNLPPADLAQAATLIAAQFWNESPFSGLEEEAIGPYRKRRAPADQGGAFAPAVDRILAKYRNPFAKG